jgi:hypothetical protein
MQAMIMVVVAWAVWIFKFFKSKRYIKKPRLCGAFFSGNHEYANLSVLGWYEKGLCTTGLIVRRVRNKRHTGESRYLENEKQIFH